MTGRLVTVVVCVLAFRAVAQDYQPIDISRFIDRPLTSYKPNESWAAPPRGLQTLEGVPFQLVGKIELTGLGSARDGRFYPARVTGIAVGRKAGRIHVLHGAGYADRDGTPIAEIVMNYADGGRYMVPLAYGVHTRNWYVERNETTAAVTDTNSIVAWKGSCPDTDRMGVTLRLFKTVFPNPSPQREIKSIDILSLFSRATPVIVAITTGSGNAPPFSPTKFDDSPYRRELIVRTDPATAAVINVNATDSIRTYKFGAYTNVSNASAVIDYSPQMKRLQLTVNSADFLPVVTNVEKDFPGELVVKLDRGSSIGGFVRTTTGKPIPAAEVIVSHVTEDQPGEFVERDLAWTKTDEQGHWTISSLVGTNFSQFNFAVRHRDFIAGNFQQSGDTNGTLTTDAFVTGKAQFVLAKGASVTGTVVDADTGKPLTTFKMIPGKLFGFRDGPLRWERGDSFAGWDGKFTFRFTEDDVRSDFGLAIEAPGYLPAASPRYTNFGNYTHHFRLKKGEGIRGVVTGRDGKPIAGARVLLVDANESAMMISEAGVFDEGSSRNVSWATSDAHGQFQFEPRLDADTILAAHETGYAEVPAESAAKSGKLVLQPWAAIKGVLRVGGKVETNHLVALGSMEYRYGEAGRFRPPLHLRLKTVPDAAGNFAFPKVPPGLRRIHLQYWEYPGPVPLSHGFAVDAKPDETANVTIGGNGQRVTGKMTAKSPIDWMADMHLLTRKHPDEPSSRSFSVDRAFWTSETGRAFERNAFQYFVVFQSDGSFRIDDVPPGNYSLLVRPTEHVPGQVPFSMGFRALGELRTNIVVGNQPLDLGTLELKMK